MAFLNTNIVNVARQMMANSDRRSSKRMGGHWIHDRLRHLHAATVGCESFRSEKLLLQPSVLLLRSVFCGMAWDQDSLIVFRVLQALGPAFDTETGMTLIAEAFPREEREWLWDLAIGNMLRRPSALSWRLPGG